MTNSILLFMGIGGQEMILIAFGLVFLFGAKKIPELARGMGRGIRVFKDEMGNAQRSIEEEINSSPKNEPTIKEQLDEVKQKLK